MIHILNPKQVGTTRQFLACFVEPEVITQLPTDKLPKLKLKAPNLLQKSLMFVGSEVNDMISRLGKG